jgi:hypothetical protein
VVTASSGLDRQIPRQQFLVRYSIYGNNTYQFYHCWPARIVLYRLERGNFTSLANDQSYLKPRKLPQFVGFVNQSIHSPCPPILWFDLPKRHRESKFEDYFTFKIEVSRQSVLNTIKQDYALRSQIFNSIVCVTPMIISNVFRPSILV